MPPELSVVIPVYRNGDTVVLLYQEIVRVLEGLVRFEILYVDDSSPDDSFSVLRSIAETDKRVRVLKLDRNLGQNRAVVVGMAHSRGKCVLAMDADLQDSPDEIPRLWRALGSHGAVFAGRVGQYEGPGRLWSSRIFKWSLHLLSGRRIPSDAGLFVIMSSQMCERILRFRDRNPYLIELMGATRLSLVSVPVLRKGNPGGRTTYSTRMRVQLAWRALAGPFRRWWDSSSQPLECLRDRVIEEVNCSSKHVEQ